MKSLFLGLSVVLVFILSSCGETCTTCTLTYEVGGIEQTAVQPEVCGSNSEIKDYKDSLQDLIDQTIAAVGGSNGSSACVDN